MIKKIAIVLLMSLLVILPTGAKAYSSEIATTTPYYAHPISGLVEDAGNDPGIGQGMIETVLQSQALVEEVDGKLFLTVRYSLAENISNETFAVQNRGEKDFYLVDYQLIKSDAETRDYRFEIPSKSAIIRSSFFVTAMGRDIVFYFDIKNFVPGNTDFKTFEDNNLVQENNSIQTNNLEYSEEEISSADNTVNVVTSDNKNQDRLVEVKEKTEIDKGKLGYSHGLLMKDSEELKELLGEKTQEAEIVEEEDGEVEYGFFTKLILANLFGLFVFLTFVLIITTLITSFYLKYLKLQNQRMLESYDEE